MVDGVDDRDLRVELARTDGRLQGALDRLDRQEIACERRAGGHVDQRVHDTERRVLREDLATIRDRLTDLDARQRGAEKLAEDALDALEEKLTVMRRHAVLVVVGIGTAILSALVAVLT